MEIKIIKGDNITLKLSLKYKENYYFNIYDKSENHIGDCGLRLDENEENYYLGNIEYEIFEPYRGHNYSEEASRLLLDIARYYNVNQLIITANPKNGPSKNIIKKLGGIFLEIVSIPKSCRLYKQGDRFVARYMIENKGEKVI